MLVIDLFDRDNILCPEWLTNEYLEDEWMDSTYSYNEGYHIWNLENPFGKLRICFNGEQYCFQALNDNGDWLPFTIITKDDVIQH